MVRIRKQELKIKQNLKLIIMNTENYIDENGKEIEVIFDDMQYQFMGHEDHSSFYECRGYDKDGNTYAGTCEICCDELVSIEDIEDIERL